MALGFKRMTPTQANLRKLVVQSLELFSSEEAAFEYQQQVPIANVPAELFCWWFDDTYMPSSGVFCSAFTLQELRDLAAFNKVFESASSQIGEPPALLEQLFALPSWQQVAQSAQVALKSLGVAVPNKAFKRTGYACRLT